MPTATSTISTSTTPANTTLPLKASPTVPHSPQTPTQLQPSTVNTLRSLYTRAARAFLHRDVPLTHSLVTDAFCLISPPPSSSTEHFRTGSTRDVLAVQRRKWDILRITLEVTVYSSPPGDTASIPPALRSNAMMSSSSFISVLHTRSLQLFTPDGAERQDAVWLPSQVLVTLVLTSLKTDCAVVGRQMVEQWLVRRGCLSTSITGPAEEDGYEKVLEVYCLNVLPALEEWEYAVEFLEYERELASERKQVSRRIMDFSNNFLSPLRCVGSHSPGPMSLFFC